MKILLVVDMQNDFVYGPLGNDQTKAVVSKVAQKIQSARAEGYKIAFTMDTHQKNYLSTLEGKHLPIPHCIEGTHGWELVQAIANVCADNDICITKDTFGRLPIAEQLLVSLVTSNQMTLEDLTENDEVTDIVLVGVCTDICVISNALILKSFFTHPEHHVEIHVDADCCAGTTPENHQSALNVMKSCQIIVEEAA